jgi:hypothetical protein
LSECVLRFGKATLTSVDIFPQLHKRKSDMIGALARAKKVATNFPTNCPAMTSMAEARTKVGGPVDEIGRSVDEPPRHNVCARREIGFCSSIFRANVDLSCSTGSFQD